jgi:hypothetical protein
MRRGIMVFDGMAQEWNLWFGQQSYPAFEGMLFEIRINNRYYQTLLGKDDGWFVTLEEEITFDLRVVEVYKIRIISIELLTLFEDVPF